MKKILITILVIAAAYFCFWVLMSPDKKAVETYEKIEDAAVGTYQKIEDAAVGTYQKIEDKALGKEIADTIPSQEDSLMTV